MKIDLDFIDAWYLRALIEKRMIKLDKELEHYHERRNFISEEVYQTKTSIFTYELDSLIKLRRELTRIVTLLALSEDILVDLDVCSECEYRHVSKIE